MALRAELSAELAAPRGDGPHQAGYEHRVSEREHKIADVAHLYDISEAALRAANLELAGRFDHLLPGDKVFIPAVASRSFPLGLQVGLDERLIVVQPGDTFSKLAKLYNVSPLALHARNPHVQSANQLAEYRQWLVVPNPPAGAVVAPAPTPTPAPQADHLVSAEVPYLELGSTSPHIPHLRRALNQLGYKPALPARATDDKFDHALREAVLWFQREFETYEGSVDGQVYEQTWAALNRALGQPERGARPPVLAVPAAPGIGGAIAVPVPVPVPAPVPVPVPPAPQGSGRVRGAPIAGAATSQTPARPLDVLDEEPPTSLLRSGHRRPAVAWLQRMLNRVDPKNQLEVDEHFGGLGRDAVIRFQQLHQKTYKLKPNGIVDAATRAALIAEAQAHPPTPLPNLDRAALPATSQAAYDLVSALRAEDPVRLRQLSQWVGLKSDQAWTSVELGRVADYFATLGMPLTPATIGTLGLAGKRHAGRIGYNEAHALVVFVERIGSAAAKPQAMNVRAYDAFIAEAARQENIPEALIRAIIFSESKWRPDATSPTGAAGLMQIMPETATSLAQLRPHLAKLPRNRYDPRLNILGGAAYLRWMADNYFGGDVRLLAAAYNGGPGAVRSRGKELPIPNPRLNRPQDAAQLRELAVTYFQGDMAGLIDAYDAKTGKLRTRGDVPPFHETRGYVPRVVSAYAYYQNQQR